MNGQVSVLRIDNSEWALHLGDPVQPRQTIVTGVDGYALLQVSDGSTFEVFPSARVVFRETPANWEDLLDVFLGRVKVHIQKLSGGRPNYNKVRTATAVISVRGTIFDVAVEDDDATTLVSVEEGEVGVRHLLMPSEDKILDAGEWIRVYRNQPLASKTVDRSGVVRGALRAAADAMYEIMYRSTHGAGVSLPGGGGGSGGGSGTGVGEKGPSGNGTGGAPPPPPPAPSH